MINYEITYTSNPRFVFHDSRGIEAGEESIEAEAESIEAREDSEELRIASRTELIQKFIDDRAQEKYLEDQLHAIW